MASGCISNSNENLEAAVQHALHVIALCRPALPRAAGFRPRSAPAFRQVRQLAEAGISLVHLPETDDSAVRWIIGRAAQKLPAPIISIVGDEKDRRTFKNLTRGDRRRVGLVGERPSLHDPSLRASA
jgi:hypothetical protein